MADLPRGIPSGYFSGSNGGNRMSPRSRTRKIQPVTDVDDSAVADRIREALENVDLSRREVAEAVDVGEKVIHSWARLGQISKHKLPIFAEVTGTSVDFLLTGRAPNNIYTRTDDRNVVQFSRGMSAESGRAEVSIRDCPVIELPDLIPYLPEESVKGSTNPGMEILDDIFDGWSRNQSDYTSMPVPLLETSGFGLPKFGLQVIGRDHEPTLRLGDLLAFAVDLLPGRNDFCIMARRRKKDVWAIGAGFFNYNQAVTHITREIFLNHMSKTDGYVLELHANENGSRDPFIIDCLRDEWLVLGVAVYQMNWLNSHQRLYQTRLGERLDRRFNLRGRHDPDA